MKTWKEYLNEVQLEAIKWEKNSQKGELQKGDRVVMSASSAFGYSAHYGWIVDIKNYDNTPYALVEFDKEPVPRLIPLNRLERANDK